MALSASVISAGDPLLVDLYLVTYSRCLVSSASPRFSFVRVCAMYAATLVPDDCVPAIPKSDGALFSAAFPADVLFHAGPAVIQASAGGLEERSGSLPVLIPIGILPGPADPSMSEVQAWPPLLGVGQPFAVSASPTDKFSNPLSSGSVIVTVRGANTTATWDSAQAAFVTSPLPALATAGQELFPIAYNDASGSVALLPAVLQTYFDFATAAELTVAPASPLTTFRAGGKASVGVRLRNSQMLYTGAPRWTVTAVVSCPGADPVSSVGAMLLETTQTWMATVPLSAPGRCRVSAEVDGRAVEGETVFSVGVELPVSPSFLFGLALALTVSIIVAVVRAVRAGRLDSRRKEAYAAIAS
jgi:hypothetical protein